MGGANDPQRQRLVAGWLSLSAAMVLVMTVVGGATRLTHSGLSIVEWQPLVGAIPPLSERDWLALFAKYQATPEGRLVNAGMTLDAFKGIFWWEYVHRLLGRTIGLVVFLPLAVFWWRGWITRPLARVIAGIIVLGGLQGAMGWYMVRSGLVDNPAVSPFRLTAHLLLAFAIFAALWWTALGVRQPRGRPAPTAVRRHAWIVTAVVLYMVTTGGFVAGTHAGLTFNTFPLMGDRLVPPDLWMLAPWWHNLYANLATVQFDHRLGFWALLILVPWLWRRVRRDSPGRATSAAGWLLAMYVLQAALGITTLLLAVPIPIAVLHQGGAMLLFGASLSLNHALKRS